MACHIFIHITCFEYFEYSIVKEIELWYFVNCPKFSLSTGYFLSTFPFNSLTIHCTRVASFAIFYLLFVFLFFNQSLVNRIRMTPAVKSARHFPRNVPSRSTFHSGEYLSLHMNCPCISTLHTYTHTHHNRAPFAISDSMTPTPHCTHRLTTPTTTPTNRRHSINISSAFQTHNRFTFW